MIAGAFSPLRFAGDAPELSLQKTVRFPGARTPSFSIIPAVPSEFGRVTACTLELLAGLIYGLQETETTRALMPFYAPRSL